MNLIKKRFDPALVRLYGYLIPYKWKLILAGIFLVGTASTSSLTATLLGKLTDLGFYQGEKWIIYAAPAALLGVSLLFAICSVFSSYVMTDISQSILVRIREEMFKSILRWPSLAYQEHTTGLVSSKFVNEASVALGGATQSLSVLVRDSIQVFALLCVLFYYNWQLTLVTFLIGPGLVFILRKISKRVRKIVKENQETLGRMISRVQETYEAEKLVKISNTYDFEDRRFDDVSGKIEKLTLKTIKMSSISTPATQLLTMVAIAFVVAVALVEAQQKILTIGEFITFLSAMLLMKAPIQHLAGLNATFATISVAAKSIFEIIDTVPEKDEGTKIISSTKGDFVFEHVYFRYPGQREYALKDINFSVRSGEHIALVGMSGSGKTSLVNLIPRYWEITSGSIRLDGTDIRELTLDSLRKQIAIVSQEIILFDDTIRNNIIYGCENATDEMIQAAVKGAALEEFVSSLPKGLDTPIGEAGNLLSGGQKQRLSIARAILKDAPILILDEPTSALDSKNEFAVKEALKNLTKGKTTFTVAHRLSTIEDASRIIVLDHGEIRESGTDFELREIQGGLYRKLRQLQGLENTKNCSRL
jgi:subfamily B ATP-binding cassette protein MsbA